VELKEGIIVKTIKYQDSSKIAYILTKDGLISALIKNCLNMKSKNYSYSKEASLIGFDLSLSKKNTFDVLTTGSVIDSFINIQNNYQKLICAVEILSLTYEYSNFIEDNFNFYNLVKNILIKINNNDFTDLSNYIFYTYIFKLKILYLLGVGPNFTKCNICNNDNIVQFDIDSGLCYCEKHSKSFNQKELIEVLKILYLGKIELFNEEIFNTLKIFNSDINRFINNYYERFLHLSNKNKKIFDKLYNI